MFCVSVFISAETRTRACFLLPCTHPALRGSWPHTGGWVASLLSFTANLRMRGSCLVSLLEKQENREELMLLSFQWPQATNLSIYIQNRERDHISYPRDSTESLSDTHLSPWWSSPGLTYKCLNPAEPNRNKSKWAITIYERGFGNWCWKGPYGSLKSCS